MEGATSIAWSVTSPSCCWGSLGIPTTLSAQTVLSPLPPHPLAAPAPAHPSAPLPTQTLCCLSQLPELPHTVWDCLQGSVFSPPYSQSPGAPRHGGFPAPSSHRTLESHEKTPRRKPGSEAVSQWERPEWGPGLQPWVLWVPGWQCEDARGCHHVCLWGTLEPAVSGCYSQPLLFCALCRATVKPSEGLQCPGGAVQVVLCLRAWAVGAVGWE